MKPNKYEHSSPHEFLCEQTELDELVYCFEFVRIFTQYYCDWRHEVMKQER
jgi:hypothetical protein